MKKVIAIAIALLIAFVLVKVASWVIWNIFTLALNIMYLLVIAAVAVPLYFYIKNKWFR